MSSKEPISGAPPSEVQVHQAELRQELGTVDVVLAQITYIVTLEFFGTAVKAGSSHAVLLADGDCTVFRSPKRWS